MKILLLITACRQNLDRIKFQIDNLKKHNNILKQFNIVPVFVFGNIALDEDLDYITWNLNIEERYTNLYLKIIKAFEKSLEKTYDFLIKIDDDTIVNWDRFELSFLESYDYIGRFQNFYTQNKLIIDLPMFNINRTINLYPQMFDKNFSFATGDFYCLSKKAVEYIVSKKDFVYENFKETEYICEDQLFGYLLQTKDIKINDLMFSDINIQLQHKLQITRNLLSIHPINTTFLKFILHKTPEQQLEDLTTNVASNLLYRETLLNNLQENLIKEVVSFVNSKKLMGMG